MIVLFFHPCLRILHETWWQIRAFIQPNYLVKKEQKIYEWFLDVQFSNALNKPIPCQLQEHERALVDAIARLADISDGEQGMNVQHLFCLHCTC